MTTNTSPIRTLDDFLSRLQGVKTLGAGNYQALCPGHVDKNPSLSISFKNRKILLHCHAGCLVENIVAAMGLHMADLSFDSGQPAPGQKKEVAVYKYLGFEQVRYEPKDFRARRSDGHGGYIWNLEGVTLTLYHQKELPAAIATGAVIYITEGEKDVDRLRGLGLTATCNAFGAGKWKDHYSTALKGADLVIIPDADQPGRDHGVKVAQACQGIAARVRILELPGAGKDISAWLDNGGTIEQLKELAEACPAWSSAIVSNDGTTPVDKAADKGSTPLIPGNELLDKVAELLLKYVVLSRTQAMTAALWVAHTHAFDAAETTPYLHISSAEKRSGKTRMLEVLELLVNRPWLTGRITPAVLARKVDKDEPTLLLDESDAAFNGDKEYAETLRGILNTGHRRGGKSSVCTGQGANISFKDLSTFCPKAIAGIGKLPDTVSDRSITIMLKRRTASESIERFRRRKVEQPAQLLRDSLTALASTLKLTGAEPELPQELDDRAADSWEPLLAIADAIGNDWPQKARAAAIDLSCGGGKEDQSLGIRLLSDIKSIFDEKGADRLPSAELVQALNSIEEAPWVDIDHKPLSANKMARLLKPYGVMPKNIRQGTAVPKGYIKVEFTDAWKRYSPAIGGILSATTATLDTNHERINNATPSQNSQNVAEKPHVQLSLKSSDVADEGCDGAGPVINPGQDGPPAPPHDSGDDIPPSDLAAPRENIIELWNSKGRPVIHLRAGENCQDLTQLLSRADILLRHTEAVNKWFIDNGGA